MADETSTRARSRRRRAQDVPASSTLHSSSATAFAAKAKDLEALRNAVVEAAGVGAGLWLSYLFVFFYLVIAAGGVTHRDLFFANPIKLPFLNVELPLIGFFVLGPLLFLIVHGYVLLHFVLLADKVGAFHDELRKQITDDDARARLRRQLPSNIFVQFLAGPREVRTGVMGFLLRSIAQISLVAAPIALLVLFQLQFLPYHHEVISWWHRIAVVADLAVLWILWPSVARGEMTWIGLRDFRRVKIIGFTLLSLIPPFLVITIATFPGEWLDVYVRPVRLEPFIKFMSKTANPETSLHTLLFGGTVDLVTRKPTSLWSNVLVLPGIDAIDRAKFDTDAKIAAVPATLSLRGRRLEGAVLTGADLRKVDFTGAQLQRAMLEDAQLQRATLTSAQLQGASLFRAQMQGASLDFAELQGASLDQAHLQGASLLGAELQGASLDDAQLQGASLDHPWLQGASLDHAQLQGASLVGIFAWRADSRNTSTESARIVAPVTKAIYVGLDCPIALVCDWSADSFAALKRLIEKQVPEGERRADALKRIATLDPATRKPEEEMAEAWRGLAKSSSFDAYQKSLAERLRETGCDAVGAPYAIRGLLRNFDRRFESGSTQPAALARAFLDEEHCPGARGLSEKDKAKLREIRDRRDPAEWPSSAPAMPKQ